ncbi:MAG TPA: hypothetical protein VLZ83_01585 [Edaphocola sp.]|nr:hypothetical protein [Edaphocola sp.]
MYKKHEEEHKRLDSHLGIDPLADGGGQQVLSPYHAMGCNPAMMIDPLGLQGQTSMSTPGNDHFIMPVGYMVEGTYVYLSADRLGTGKSIGMKRLEAYIYNSMMEMAEAKQQKLIEIRFAAALAMVDGYNSIGNDAVDPVQLKDWSTFGTDRVSFIFGKTTISFSKRGGGEGKKYFLDEDIRTGIWVFAVYYGDLSKYEKTDWIQSVYTSKGIDGKPSNKWFNDYNKGLDSNEPFYYNNSAFTIEWRNKIDAKFGGRAFMDGPNRMSY